jgi:hypothetical protein
MAITSAICTSFKVELLKGVHDFTATTGDTFKIALYDSDATLGASTTAFSTSEEITNTIQFPTADATNAIIRLA